MEGLIAARLIFFLWQKTALQKAPQISFATGFNMSIFHFISIANKKKREAINWEF